MNQANCVNFIAILFCLCVQSIFVFVSAKNPFFLASRSRAVYLTPKNKSNMLRMYSTVCYPEESKKIVRAKNNLIITADNVEESPIDIREVPSLSAIQKLAKQTEKTVDSLSYCQYSGGYPNESIKESVYLKLWACLTHELNTMQ